ncbi:MHS family MFS transporter (plasmid) [Agrobacterium leguminum]|uniref:MHS family MFS transporter n=1 Tax=Agrobacterium TaxID=357 RepID=UPI0010C94254|nr:MULTISPECIES: MHS family MFS transporter [Agrobacterium]WFS69716.1 MHS family MFS transporter [Agrobacterium leguminum]
MSMVNLLANEDFVAPRDSVPKRATIASDIGSILKTEDVKASGAAAATVFTTIFFSAMNSNTAILATFGTFGVAFSTRPLGSLIFRTFEDRVGRKNVLLIYPRTDGSCHQPCLPKRNSIGFAAPLGLVLLRLFQGIALGEPVPTKERYSGSATSYIVWRIDRRSPSLVMAWLAQNSEGGTFVVTCFATFVVACALIAIIASPQTIHQEIKHGLSHQLRRRGSSRPRPDQTQSLEYERCE